MKKTYQLRYSLQLLLCVASVLTMLVYTFVYKTMPVLILNALLLFLVLTLVNTKFGVLKNKDKTEYFFEFTN